uniref:Uncharacterized protein n=2 Tax=Pseudo-nitzschia australis TaxID=44445 RepID=A0A7S4ARB6_9STRA
MTDHQHTNEIIRENKTSESSADHDISTGENIPIPALSKSLSFPGVGSIAGSFIEQSRKAEDARPLLPRAAFFMGDMKDGLPMLNMQAVFLMSSKNFSEKQIGVLFLAFGLSQFLCMTPAGYFLDYSNHKIDWVNWSGLITSLLTVTTVITAHDGGSNMGLMILLKILQGGTSAILPPGFNSVTLGIVGSTGFTVQVAKNRTMNHVGTALIVAIGTLIAYLLYPNIGALFIVSPLTMIGVYHNMVRIKPNHINRDAARALIIESPTMTEYEHLEIKHTMGSHVNGMSYEGSEYTEADTTSFTDSSNQSNAYIPPTANTTVPVIDESPIVSVDANVTKSQEMVQLDNNNNNNNNNKTYTGIPPQPEESNGSMPSFRFGWARGGQEGDEYMEANTISSTDSSNQSNSYIPPTANTPTEPVVDESHVASVDPKVTKSQEMAQVDNTVYASPPQPQESNGSMPSFRFGWRRNQNKNRAHQPRTPLAVLLDPTLVLFTLIVFAFHMANSAVLPLVMQSLAVEDDRSWILLSGLCIFIGQFFMSWFAKLCGDYSPKWGRKGLTLGALSALTIRCLCLAALMTAKDEVSTPMESIVVKSLIVATQLLDSVGAGIFGTMHILVTNDISSRSGRFSLMMGITSSAMCLGSTVSSYIGQSIAQDFGYSKAFTSLGGLSLVPLLMYSLFMPETLPDYARPKNRKRRLVAILKRINEERRRFFRRRRSKKIGKKLEDNDEKHEGLVPQQPDSDDFQHCAKPDMELV